MDYQTTEYRGKAILVLDPESKFRPFSFGLKKAALILENIPAIEAYVADHAPNGVAVSTYRTEANDFPRTPQVDALDGMSPLGK